MKKYNEIIPDSGFHIKPFIGWFKQWLEEKVVKSTENLRFNFGAKRKTVLVNLSKVKYRKKFKFFKNWQLINALWIATEVIERKTKEQRESL